MRVLGIIPARGGSKGVPRKNIKLLCGQPLMAYTVHAAQAAKHLTQIVLSTEDEEIASVGRSLGLDVPFMRPADLATDVTPTLDVLLHVVSELETLGQFYDAICLLQVTNPMRKTQHIDDCIALLESDPKASSVISVLPVPTEYNPHWVYQTTSDGALRLFTGESTPIPRRQALPPAFHREGSVYVVRRDVLMNEKTLYGERVLGYSMENQDCCNIDTMDDWHDAERRLCGKMN